MLRKISILFAIILLPHFAFAGADGTHDDGNLVMIEDDNAEMKAAIAEAQRTLPLFLRHALEDGKSLPEASIKVDVPVPTGGSEAIWVASFSPIGGERYRGVLVNQPESFPGKLHDEIEFDKSEIIDWDYFDLDARKSYGHYTTRVLIPLLPEEMQNSLNAMLADNPIPKGW